MLRLAIEVIGFIGWLRYDVMPLLILLALIGLPTALAISAIVQTINP